VTVRERFDAKYRIDESGCWLWTASLNAGGYGQFASGSIGTRLAHRWRWEMENGPVPEGLELDHLCRVRHCVNPAHLEPVTRRENLLRGETLTAKNAAADALPEGPSIRRRQPARLGQRAPLLPPVRLRAHVSRP